MKIKSVLLRDVFHTYLAQFIVAISGIFLIKIFTLYFDKEMLGVYLNIRRVVWVILPLVTLKLGMSEAKFINKSNVEGQRYLFVTLVITLILLISLCVFSLLFAKSVSSFLFARSDMTMLILPLFIFITAYSYHLILIGLFRGLNDFTSMNIISILFWISSVILALIIRNIIDNDIKFLMYYFEIHSLFIFISETAVLLNKRDFFKDYKLRKAKFKNLFRNNAAFIKYGVSRIPTGFMQASIFFLPSYFATHYISLEAAGEIGLIVSIIRISQLLIAPLTLLLLPKFAFLQHKNILSNIKSQVTTAAVFTLTFSFFIGTSIILFSREIILYWFGKDYLTLSMDIMIIGFFISFYLIYIALRSIIDGLFVFPYTTIISFFSFLIMIVISLAGIALNNIEKSIMLSIIAIQVFSGLSLLMVLIHKTEIKLWNKSFSPFVIRNIIYILIVIAFVCISKNINLINSMIKLIIFLITSANLIGLMRKNINLIHLRT